MTAWKPVIDEILGRFTAASNVTLLAAAGGEQVIYKPIAGNRPLWDFDVGTLAVREVLTAEVAAACGFDIVPETVLADGPLGPGAVQRYVASDPDFDPFVPIEAGDPELWPVVVLDVVVNNADRKLGHLIRELGSGRLLAIDHGLTFHPEDKLRTVLWGFAGRALPDPQVAALHRLQAAFDRDLADRVAATLGPAEAAALGHRVHTLLETGRHPEPPADRHPLPWPPY